MYIYDTGFGYEVYVVDITPDGVVKSYTNPGTTGNKLSIIKYDKSEEPYFTRLGHKIYLRDLKEFQ